MKAKEKKVLEYCLRCERKRFLEELDIRDVNVLGTSKQIYERYFRIFKCKKCGTVIEVLREVK